MSLNRCEEALLDYLEQHPDEHRFWKGRVQGLAASSASREARASQLERELRDYASERAHADASLRATLGGGVVRLRNLSEYLLRIWGPPLRPPRATSHGQVPR